MKFNTWYLISDEYIYIFREKGNTAYEAIGVYKYRGSVEILYDKDEDRCLSMEWMHVHKSEQVEYGIEISHKAIAALFNKEILKQQ